jgi:hypothetical protein
MKLDPLLLILVAAIVLWPSRAYGRRVGASSRVAREKILKCVCASRDRGPRLGRDGFNCTKELALDFRISLLCNRGPPSTGCTPSCVRRKRWPRPIP